MEMSTSLRWRGLFRAAFGSLRRRAELAWRLASETLDEFSKDRGDLVAAGIAFYTLLSLAPLIIIAVAIAGVVLGEGAARHEVKSLLQGTMGADPAAAVDAWVRQASQSGGVASLVGVLLTLFAASKFTSQLRNALNQIWNVDVSIANGFKETVEDYLRRRFFALMLVAAAGPLLLLIFVSRALLTGIGNALAPDWIPEGIAVQGLQLLFSTMLVTAMSTLVFRIIPDTRVGWRAVWWGGLLTSIFFNFGNFVVGLYLAKAGVAAAYGAAGSVVVVLLWLYFSAEIFILGAEFTQVYSRHFGRGLNPKEQGEVQRAEQAGAESRLAPRGRPRS